MFDAGDRLIFALDLSSMEEVKRWLELLRWFTIHALPGIRQVAGGDDQARIATPEFAIKKGSDFLIIGRPIRTSTDPVKTVRDIVKEMEEAVCQD